MTRLFHFLFPIVLAALLAGCFGKTLKDAEYTVNKDQQKLMRIQEKSTTPSPAVTNSKGYYVSTRPISLQSSPAWMKDHITLRARNVPFNFIVGRILRDTNVAVNYQPQTNQNQIVSMNYDGTIKGALEQLSADTNYAYEIQNNELTWEAFVTRTFNISFMPGTSNYQVGQNEGLGAGEAASVANVNGASGTNNIVATNGDLGAQEYSNLKGSLSVWDDLGKTLNELKSADGKVSVSQSTTTVTVYDHPTNVQAISDYIDQLNRDLSREVAIQVEVLEIDLNKDFNYGINWNLVEHWLGNSVSLSANLATAANITGAITQSGVTNGIALFQIGEDTSNAIIQALQQQGKVSVVTQPRVVTMNNQMAEIRITRQVSYLQSVSTTTVANAGNTTSLTPGIVTDGFSLYLLPKIQGKNVYLQISSSLAVLTAIDTVSNAPTGADVNASSTSGSATPQFQAIQVPTLAQKTFNQRTLVSSGSTLVITGFQQTRNSSQRSQLFGIQPLGGVGASRRNSQTLVLITPTILGKY